jgi:hypothetical protein
MHHHSNFSVDTAAPEVEVVVTAAAAIDGGGVVVVVVVIFVDVLSLKERA